MVGDIEVNILTISLGYFVFLKYDTLTVSPFEFFTQNLVIARNQEVDSMPKGIIKVIQDLSTS